MFHWKTRCFHLLDSDSLESESFRLGRSVQRVLTTRWLSYLTSESFTPKAIMKNSFFKNVINILCHLSHERESKIPAFPEGTPLSSNEKSFPGAAKSLSWFQPIHQGWRKSCQLHLHPWRRTDGQSVNSGTTSCHRDENYDNSSRSFRFILHCCKFTFSLYLCLCFFTSYSFIYIYV